jgi:hypothetical protein
MEAAKMEMNIHRWNRKNLYVSDLIACELFLAIVLTGCTHGGKI